jgi:hypothetical protein
MTEDLLPNWDPEGQTWPLLFTYVNLVDAASFRATVEISGALVAIIHPGDGSCWLDGVYPGGTAASGTNVDDAYANFREFITGIIHDMADDCGTLAAFEQWMRIFVTSTDETTLGTWRDGVRKVRNNAPGTPPLERRDSEGWTPDFAVHEVTSTAIVSAEFDRSLPAQIAA